MQDPIHCPDCEEPVQPIFDEDDGYRCPVCQRPLNEQITESE